MWIEKTPAGTFKYCERFKNEYTGKTHKVCITHKKKNKMVQSTMPALLYEKYLEKHSMAEEKNKRDVPLRVVLDETLENLKNTKASATYMGYKSAYNSLPTKIKDVLISKVYPAMFNRYLDQLYGEGASNSKMQTAASALRIALRYATDNGYGVDPVVAEGIKYEPRPEVPDTAKYLTLEELLQVEEQLINMGHHNAAYVVHTQAMTGMRVGEVLALRLKDVDVEAKTIHVSRTINQYTGEYGPTKTRDVREALMMLDLPDMFEKVLNARRRAGATEEDIIFLNKHHTPMRYSSVRTPLEKVQIERLDKVTSHIFRHTYVTFLIDEGFDINLIARQVGHSSTRMVEEVYGHYTDKARSRFETKLANIEIDI